MCVTKPVEYKKFKIRHFTIENIKILNHEFVSISNLHK